MTADSAGKRKKLEKLFQALLVLGSIGIDLRIGSFEVAVGEHGGRTMARSRDVEHVQVVLPDEPVEVHPDEALAGVGAPVAEQPMLDMFGPQRLSQQRIVAQIKHPQGQVITGPPVCVDQFYLFCGKITGHANPHCSRLSRRIDLGYAARDCCLTAKRYEPVNSGRAWGSWSRDVPCHLSFAQSWRAGNREVGSSLSLAIAMRNIEAREHDVRKNCAI